MRVKCQTAFDKLIADIATHKGDGGYTVVKGERGVADILLDGKRTKTFMSNTELLQFRKGFLAAINGEPRKSPYKSTTQSVGAGVRDDCDSPATINWLEGHDFHTGYVVQNGFCTGW